MKKVLLTMFMAVTTLVAMAQTTNYTDNLVVTINGISNEPQKTDITVEQNNDGTYTLSLNKFTLISGEDIMPVGNIVLENIEATEENGIKSFCVVVCCCIELCACCVVRRGGGIYAEEFGA